MGETIWKLISFMITAPKAMGLMALSEATGIDVEELRQALNELLSLKLITVNNKKRYSIVQGRKLRCGVYSIARISGPRVRFGKGHTSTSIKYSNFRPLPDDMLLVQICPYGKCKVKYILWRGRDTIAVKIHKPGSTGAAVSAGPCNPMIKWKVELTGELSSFNNGDIVLLSIDSYPEADNPIVGHPVRLLGSANSAEGQQYAFAEEYGFSTAFPDVVEREANELLEQPMPEPDAHREDLRGLTLFTIDGEEAKDFDDAVSIEPLETLWRLGVHIADVSHYVRPGTALDDEAYARGTSQYLPKIAVPMLPEVLSNNLCSLLPDADRPALSLFMDVSSDGSVLCFRLTRSIIRSKARLTYARVNRFFGDMETFEQNELNEALTQMRVLARRLHAIREAHGCVELNIEDPVYVFDAQGEPEEICCPERGEAENMIAEFMILANVTVARMARDNGVPFIYRVHDAPFPMRAYKFKSTLRKAGIHMKLAETITPDLYQKMLTENADSEFIIVIRHLALSTLEHGRYSEQPQSHFALGVDCYCHFTSPIRRYADLSAHRMLKLMLDGRTAEYPQWEARMPELSEQCTRRHEEAKETLHEYIDLLNARWMKRHIGDEFDGFVSAVRKIGLRILLPNEVKGWVLLTDIGEPCSWDSDRHQLSCEGSGIIWRVGMKVRVKAIAADVQRADIRFALVEILSQPAVGESAAAMDEDELKLTLPEEDNEVVLY